MDLLRVAFVEICSIWSPRDKFKCLICQTPGGAAWKAGNLKIGSLYVSVLETKIVII